MTNQQIDPELLKKALASGTFENDDEVQGKRPLTPAGLYMGCRITLVSLAESTQYPNKNGSPKLQAQYRFDCPTSDVELSKFISIGKHPKGTYYKFLRAVFVTDAAMLGKGPADVGGKTVDIMVTHVTEKGQTYAQFNFSPVAPGPAAKKA